MDRLGQLLRLLGALDPRLVELGKFLLGDEIDRPDPLALGRQPLELRRLRHPHRALRRGRSRAFRAAAAAGIRSARRRSARIRRCAPAAPPPAPRRCGAAFARRGQGLVAVGDRVWRPRPPRAPASCSADAASPTRSPGLPAMARSSSAISRVEPLGIGLQAPRAPPPGPSAARPPAARRCLGVALALAPFRLARGRRPAARSRSAALSRARVAASARLSATALGCLDAATAGAVRRSCSSAAGSGKAASAPCGSRQRFAQRPRAPAPDRRAAGQAHRAAPRAVRSPPSRCRRRAPPRAPRCSAAVAATRACSASVAEVLDLLDRRVAVAARQRVSDLLERRKLPRQFGQAIRRGSAARPPRAPPPIETNPSQRRKLPIASDQPLPDRKRLANVLLRKHRPAGAGAGARSAPRRGRPAESRPAASGGSPGAAIAALPSAAAPLRQSPHRHPRPGRRRARARIPVRQRGWQWPCRRHDRVLAPARHAPSGPPNSVARAVANPLSAASRASAAARPALLCFDASAVCIGQSPAAAVAVRAPELPRLGLVAAVAERLEMIRQPLPLLFGASTCARAASSAASATRRSARIAAWRASSSASAASASRDSVSARPSSVAIRAPIASPSTKRCSISRRSSSS